MEFSFLISIHWIIFFLLQHANAIVLHDILPPQPGSFLRRDDLSSLNLQDEEIYHWGRSPNSTASMANFTISMYGDDENILSLEKFGTMLSSIECTNTSVALTFKDSGAFSYAQKQWNWVNYDNRSFILVAGTGQCHWNTYRLPFLVTSASYDNSTRTINLAAIASKWSEVAHTSELWVGGAPNPPPSRFAQRDFAQSFSLNFQHTLPTISWNFPIPVDNISATVSCPDCGTYGSFDLVFHFQTVFFVPDSVDLTLTPKGVSADFTPSVHFTASLTDKITSPLVLLGKIPIDGISIPGGVLDLGPEIVINAGASIGPLVGETTLSGGVKVYLSDSADLEIGLTSPSFQASGWDPIIDHVPLSISADIRGSVDVFLQISTQLSLEALDNGFEVGVMLQPYARAQLLAKTSASGACKGDPEKRPDGIELDTVLGVALSGDLENVDDPGNPIFSSQIAGIATTLPAACFPFGPAAT